MSIVGTVLLWAFAVLGMLVVAGAVWAWVSPNEEPTKVEASAQAPLQITNLRTLPQPEPTPDFNQPQVLQKTTMQITTTKYVDPNAAPPKELSA